MGALYPGGEIQLLGIFMHLNSNKSSTMERGMLDSFVSMVVEEMSVYDLF